MRKTTSTNFYNEGILMDACPIVFTLSKIGGRWKPLILWKLLDSKLRFSELKFRIPQISERMLILSLKELEADGLVLKKNYNVLPPKVEYILTEDGRSIQKILQEIYAWGKKSQVKN